MTTASTDPLSGPPPPLADAAALFLDFDGTLAPIAARPQDVQVPHWVHPTLRALGERLDGALAIVSGRPIAQLDDFLAPLRLITAGAHGAEWRDAQGNVHQLAAAPPGVRPLSTSGWMKWPLRWRLSKKASSASCW